MDTPPQATTHAATAAATANASSTWAALQAQRPHAARLALLACLAVRVSPALLRQARLRLLPQASAGDEADLWLSDLVETRTAAGFAYRRAVRGLLREHLRACPALLASAWQQVYQPHAAWLTPRARLELELTWRLLRDATDPAITAHWQAVLQDLGSGAAGGAPDGARSSPPSTANPEGVARWLLRAMADLPPGALDHPLAQRAWYGANLLLGDASVLGSAPQAFLASNDFSFATRRLPRRTVFVGLLDGALLVSPLRPIEQGHNIELPATRPLWLQLEHPEDPQDPAHPDTPPPQVLILDSPAPHHATIPGSAVRLRALDGTAWLLAPPPAEQAAPQQQDQRVQLGYSVELEGREVTVQLPFVVGVLADLSGQRAKSTLGLAERRFVDLDAARFDACMQAVAPGLSLVMPLTPPDGDLKLELQFKRLADFSPAVLAQQIVAALVLTGLRIPLARMGFVMLLNHEANLLVGHLLHAAASATRRSKTTQHDMAAHLAAAFDHLDAALQASLLQRLRALAAEAGSMATSVENNTPESLGDALVDRACAAYKGHEKTLTRLVAQVLHHPAFQRLENAWLGLHHLVQRTATGPLLKIRVLDVSKTELAEAFAAGLSTHSDVMANPLQAKLHDETYGTFGGEPFGLLVGDYAFDASPADVVLLGAMATLAAAAHAPFVAAASPALLGLKNWQGLAGTSPLDKQLSDPALAAWQALRQRDEAIYIGLALPRMRGRLRYGASTHPVDGFDFEEADGGQATGWINPAYGMAGNIARAFADHGWCARIVGLESGGVVDGLPASTTLAPTEVAISDRREAELSSLGLMPLLQRPGGMLTAFLVAQSLHALEMDPSDDPASARLAARWPHLLTACRVMHHLRCKVRDAAGSYRSPVALTHDLVGWLQQYVLDPTQPLVPNTPMQRPLARAEVRVLPIEGQPGFCRVQLSVQPHYQLERTPAWLVLETTIAFDLASNKA